MNILLKTVAINTNEDGYVCVDSRRVFNLDSFCIKHTQEEEEFLETLTREKWTRIENNLLDDTTARNFKCYAKLP
jgi:hypothetical protein